MKALRGASFDPSFDRGHSTGHSTCRHQTVACNDEACVGLFFALARQSQANMWMRRAVRSSLRLPWELLGAATVLTITAATLPVRFLNSAFKKQARDLTGTTVRRRVMPEVYDAQEVAAMLSMVQAAMQHKSQQLHLERTASLQMQQQVEGLQESLENMSYLFAQVCCKGLPPNVAGAQAYWCFDCTNNCCMLQEQQHRLGLQAELQAAESAAADLRQMLSMFFGDSPSCSPDTSSEGGRQTGLQSNAAWTLSSPSQLQSGLPGSLDRRDSRLQMDLAGIQKRLHKIAQLRDTPPSSPRSGERISSWTSPRSPDLGRSRTLGSRLSPLKQSPSRTGTMSPIPKQSERDDDMPSQAHVSFAERHSGPSELFYKTESISATTGTRHDGNSTAESRLNDAVSLDSSDSTRLSKKLQQSE